MDVKGLPFEHMHDVPWGGSVSPWMRWPNVHAQRAHVSGCHVQHGGGALVSGWHRGTNAGQAELLEGTPAREGMFRASVGAGMLPGSCVLMLTPCVVMLTPECAGLPSRETRHTIGGSGAIASTRAAHNGVHQQRLQAVARAVPESIRPERRVWRTSRRREYVLWFVRCLASFACLHLHQSCTSVQLLSTASTCRASVLCFCSLTNPHPPRVTLLVFCRYTSRSTKALRKGFAYYKTLTRHHAGASRGSVQFSSGDTVLVEVKSYGRGPTRLAYGKVVAFARDCRGLSSNERKRLQIGKATAVVKLLPRKSVRGFVLCRVASTLMPCEQVLSSLRVGVAPQQAAGAKQGQGTPAAIQSRGASQVVWTIPPLEIG